MRLTIKPQIQDNRYSVSIKFKEYGSSSLTSEMEQKIINDYSPSFKLSDLTFEGKYKVDSSNKVVADGGSGEEVKLTVPNREIRINQDLDIGYTVHAKEISSAEIKSNLKDTNLIAQAKVQLFIDTVTKKIDDMLKELGKSINTFEEEIELEVG